MITAIFAALLQITPSAGGVPRPTATPTPTSTISRTTTTTSNPNTTPSRARRNTRINNRIGGSTSVGPRPSYTAPGQSPD